MSLKNSCFLLSGAMSLSFPEKPMRSSQELVPQENIESPLPELPSRPCALGHLSQRRSLWYHGNFSTTH
ncbi:rCG56143 [Rattus norvegicus]|uniref:RCG56143 n=1 Tax=Rattus norvegicus TaxID=10116 RepID=A6IB59_RAT|nr:rCG56143 [Rattus norvegicus]